MSLITKHPLYHVHRDMIERCRNPNTKQWKDYGGRDIKVCSRWKQPKIGFLYFIEDMGERPLKMTLDRIDNDGDYTHDNCRWATRKQQQRNQKVTRYVIIKGKRYKAVELAEISGLKTDTIVVRANLGLSYDEVMSTNRRVFTEGLALGGKASGAKKQALTHCKKGHLFTVKNTFITPEGWRSCRRCSADREQRRRNRIKHEKT